MGSAAAERYPLGSITKPAAVFTRAIELANRYASLAGRLYPNAPANRAWGEVLGRLGLLQHLEARTRSLNEAAGAPARAIGEQIERTGVLTLPPIEVAIREQLAMEPILLDLQAFTEACYHCAWRIREMLDQNHYSFPGITRVSATGVRDVRNHLLQHPENHESPWIDWSWQYGVPVGPVLRGQSQPEEAGQYRDAGLFPNLEQFRDQLVRSLEGGVVHLESELAKRGSDAA